MKKLYTHIKSLSFFILISAGYVQGMELPATQSSHKKSTEPRKHDGLTAQELTQKGFILPNNDAWKEYRRQKKQQCSCGTGRVGY